MAVKDMYQRLKAGESIDVIVPETGREFTIKPAYSTKYMVNTVLGYSVVVDGAIVPGYKGLMLDRETVEDWGLHLDERVDPLLVGFDEAEDGGEWEQELNQIYSASRGC